MTNHIGFHWLGTKSTYKHKYKPRIKNRTKIKHIKSNQYFINIQTVLVSLESKTKIELEPVQEPNRYSKLQFIYLKLLIIFSFKITKYIKSTTYKLNYPKKTG